MQVSTNLIGYVKVLIAKPKAKQVLGLFSVNILGIPISIVTSIVVTRYMGPDLYGDFKFLNNIFSLCMVLFTFGFFQAGNRAIVLVDDKSKIREYYGAEFILTCIIFFIMSICLVIYSFLDSNIAEKNLSSYLLCMIPFGWIYLFQRLFETILPSDNSIKLLGIVRIVPKIGTLLLVVVAFFFFRGLKVDRLAVIIISYLLVQAISYIYVSFKLDYSFNNFLFRLKELFRYNKEFGFNVYLGALFAVGFSTLTGIMISYFGNSNVGVGYYALALTCASPLSFIPNTIATTHYKDFANWSMVDRKVLLITVLLSAIALLALYVLIGPFISLCYGSDFSSVIQLCYIVSVGVIIHGFGDFYNRFLGAKGFGVAIRNGAFITGLSIMILNCLLIPKYGAYGAAFVNVISSFVYFFCMFGYYLKYRRRYYVTKD